MADETTKKVPINIQIVADFMCLSCWIGKRKLEAAMQQTADLYDFNVSWEPFFLFPGLTDEGVEKLPRMKNPSILEQMRQRAASVGIKFSGRSKRLPNTFSGHQMLEYCKTLDNSTNLQSNVAERIFKNYLCEDQLLNRGVLNKIAEELCFDMAAYEGYMDCADNSKKVEETALSWKSKPIPSVPHFIINGETHISGSLEPDAFAKTFAFIADNQK
ncbi:uncharacterized protein YwbO-like isoform X1 [Watersipora subatra]|uniref:uncharacterized protein YwbO-like isoform X1 n=2 Tax=Watersipora subatra TaxID=2589382 RepID=UPI00355B190A